jgi:hypothetical protein
LPLKKRKPPRKLPGLPLKKRKPPRRPSKLNLTLEV